MKKKKIWLATAAAVLVCCLIILFVKGGDKGYSGSYRAVNPPIETGETVIERVSFEGETAGDGVRRFEAVGGLRHRRRVSGVENRVRNVLISL